ncbi:PH domain-containing protein, partial [Pseudomonas amygdali]
QRLPKESKHVMKFRGKHLQSGEQVVAWGDGYIGEMMGKGKNTQQNGSMIVTTARAIFYRAGFFGEVNETIPLKAITSIERKSFMGHRSIRLHTSHDSLEFKSFKKEQDQILVDAIESGRSVTHPLPTSSQVEGFNIMDALTRLAELKSAGHLTEKEFSSKKTELLSRL